MAKAKKSVPKGRFNKALTAAPKRDRKTISIDQADNGFVVTLRNDDNYETTKKEVANDMPTVKKIIDKML